MNIHENANSIIFILVHGITEQFCEVITVCHNDSLCMKLSNVLFVSLSCFFCHFGVFIKI